MVSQTFINKAVEELVSNCGFVSGDYVRHTMQRNFGCTPAQVDRALSHLTTTGKIVGRTW